MNKTVVILLVLISFLHVRLEVRSQNLVKKKFVAQKVTTPPDIDGRLDEEVWGYGEWGGDFTQYQPYNGAKPSQKTAFKILFDKDYLYIGIKAFDTSPDSIVYISTKRDYIDGDHIGVGFDSYHDLQTLFAFTVSSSGVKRDHMEYNNGEIREYYWNPIWDAKVSSDENGWYTEIRIPFSQLRFKKNAVNVWGLNLIRSVYRFSELNSWVFLPMDAPGHAHLYGELENLQSIKPRKQFDVLPYAVGQYESFKKVAGNPFATGQKTGLKFGLDSKIGVTNDFTVDLTINPDFGQVEADPSEVNLTVFETFFAEKRPFFVEGNNITSFNLGMSTDPGNNNLFYSRRIGRRPRISPAPMAGEYFEAPDFTKILGAAKLTGKTNDGLSVGVMEAVTANEYAHYDLDGVSRTETIEPLTNYLVGSVRKDFNKGNTIIGAMFTSTNRIFNETELDKKLHSNAYTGGVNFVKAFKNRTYLLEGHFAFSHLKGTKESITALQRSPIRQFHRKGISHVQVDSSATNLSGTGGRLMFSKKGNGHFNYKMAVSWSSPSFEINDVGYQRSSDIFTQMVWGGYHIWEPFGIFKDLDFNLTQWTEWDFGGNNLSSSLSYSSRFLFKNEWSLITSYDKTFKFLDQYALRGGPGLRMPQMSSIYFNVNTDVRKVFSVATFTVFENGQFNHFSEAFNAIRFTIRPNQRLNFALAVRFVQIKNQLQYIKTATYYNNERYLLAKLDQKNFRPYLRANFNINPELAIEYYGQPFISSGKFSEFKYVDDAQADNYANRFKIFEKDQITFVDNEYLIDENMDEVIDYRILNPDFNVRTFLSNLVLRWEYKPGSTFFLVWNQTITNYDYSINRTIGNNLSRLFNTKPHNIFLVKFSYRIGK